jgi:pentatricopeptide repeat protein
LTPEEAGRQRLKHIARAEGRLNRHVERLQRDVSRYKNKLVYDGQYRSLQRSIISLKRWDVTEEDMTKGRGIETDEEWILRAFAALDRSTYTHVNALTRPVTLRHSPRISRYAQLLLDGIDGESMLEGVDKDVAERIWSNWHNLGEKKQLYDRMLVYLLDNKPGYAQDFITVLAADQSLAQSKFVIMADALAHLAKVHVKGEYLQDQGWEATPEANRKKFIATFLLCTRFVNTAAYSQDLLHSLILLAGKEDLKKIYDTLFEWNTRFSVGTTLHYASAFGEAGEFHYALQVLERRLAAFKQTERELIVGSERFHWTCAAILRGSMREVKNYHETPNIVAAFVKLGVKMDLLLYDVVMRNAMEAGDFITAFKVYNSLDKNGLVPDKYTFSILLQGCTTQNDPAMFKAFAEFCVKKAKELEDPWLATDCLYYVYTCEQNKDTAMRNTGLIWQTYLDLLDMTPLEPFFRHGTRAMKDALDEHVVVPEVQKLAPPPMAIYLMLQTEIQTTQALGVHYLDRLYKTFKRAISADGAHPALTSLSQTPIIWNAFLHAFCEKTQYASASAVIKDMTAHGTSPNVYSWNIFMQSFFKTGQVAAADRVFEIMRSRGIDPDSYTYGVMVRGYAKAQLVDRIGETMQYIGEEEQLDPELLRMLGQVQARADLTAALEKSRVEKETREDEEQERKEKEEEKRFEPPRFASLLTNALRFRPANHWDNGPANDDFMEPDDDDPTTSTSTKETEYKSLQDQLDGKSTKTEDEPVFKSLLEARTEKEHAGNAHNDDEGAKK